jgi:hypothetical protein
MLVEDGCPLHWSPVQALACLAMAYFCVYWVCTHFNLNRLAVTACPVFDDKAGIRDRRIFRSEFFFHFAPVIWQSDQAIEGTSLQSVDEPNPRIWTMIWEA